MAQENIGLKCSAPAVFTRQTDFLTERIMRHVHPELKLIPRAAAGRNKESREPDWPRAQLQAENGDRGNTRRSINLAVGQLRSLHLALSGLSAQLNHIFIDLAQA